MNKAVLLYTDMKDETSCSANLAGANVEQEQIDVVGFIDRRTVRRKRVKAPTKTTPGPCLSLG